MGETNYLHKGNCPAQRSRGPWPSTDMFVYIADGFSLTLCQLGIRTKHPGSS